MLLVDSLEDHGHVKLCFNPVAVLPSAIDGGELPWCQIAPHFAAVYSDRGFRSRPGRDAKVNNEGLRRVRLDLDLGFWPHGKVGLLHKRNPSLTAGPPHARGHIEVHIHSTGIAEVRADPVVRRNLWKRSGAARPLVPVVALHREDVVVVPVVKTGTIFE